MGGMTCTVCRNEAREGIDRALIAGEPLRDIAGRTGLSKSSLNRHQENHLSSLMIAAANERELAHGSKLLDQVEWLLEETKESMERSKKDGAEKDFLAGARETRHTMELVGRITGEFHENNRENAAKSPLDALMEMAATVSEAYLRAVAAGEDPEGLIIEGTGHVVNPE